MSVKESEREPTQFSQEIPAKRETVKLDERYKSIGISAVSAAASIKSKKSKKVVPDQMA